MLRYLLDTDHLTLLERGHGPLVHRLAAEPAGAVGVSAVTVEEALRGRLGYLSRRLDGAARVRAYALLLGTLELFNRMPVVPFDGACEARYQHLRSLKLRVGTQDQKIAAVALANNLTVLTRNQRDFVQVPGLVVADWAV